MDIIQATTNTCEYCQSIHTHVYGSGRFCSVKCARAYATSHKRRKISEKVASTLCAKHKKIHKLCERCKKQFSVTHGKRKQRFCSRSCARRSNFEKIDLVAAGKASARAQADQRRSKNEIEFARLSIAHFKHVETNAPIFNGWDADIVIHDSEIAVLWNGRWHYEKCATGHSVEQVQARDRIKCEEIRRAGYTPYVIKDMGAHDVTFVKHKFEEFIAWLNEKSDDSVCKDVTGSV